MFKPARSDSSSVLNTGSCAYILKGEAEDAVRMLAYASPRIHAEKLCIETSD